MGLAESVLGAATTAIDAIAVAIVRIQGIIQLPTSPLSLYEMEYVIQLMKTAMKRLDREIEI
jgi:hypothetical protein